MTHRVVPAVFAPRRLVAVAAATVLVGGALSGCTRHHGQVSACASYGVHRSLTGDSGPIVLARGSSHVGSSHVGGSHVGGSHVGSSDEGGYDSGGSSGGYYHNYSRSHAGLSHGYHGSHYHDYDSYDDTSCSPSPRW